MADTPLPISLRYFPDRKLFDVRFVFLEPTFRQTLTELLAKLEQETPGVVESRHEADEPVLLVHASRLAYFMAATWEARRAADALDDEVTLHLFPPDEDVL